MTPEDSFAVWQAQWERGDSAAARDLFQRFARRLIGLARSRLHGQLQQKVDPEDIMQSVFKSFCAHDAAEPFELDNWDGLWSLLTVITLRKCGRQVEYFRAARRDIRRELPAPAPEESRAAWEALAREPSPSEAARLAETLQQVMADLNERERQILELRLQGHSVPEIGAQVSRTRFTVEGILKRIRKRLQHLRDGAPG